MSLEVDGVWKSGVWNTTVWAAGVWREGPYTPTINPYELVSLTFKITRQKDLSLGITREVDLNND